MTQIFSIIAITTIWCLGIKIVTNEGMALYSLQKFALYQIHERNRKIFEPLIYCPWCMPSIHSSVGYTFCYLLGIISGKTILIGYPIVVAGASFCTGMLWLLYNYMDKLYGHYKNVEKLSYWDVADRKSKFAQNNLRYGNQKIKAKPEGNGVHA